jgi:hypothetical protein
MARGANHHVAGSDDSLPEAQDPERRYRANDVVSLSAPGSGSVDNL